MEICRGWGFGREEERIGGYHRWVGITCISDISMKITDQRVGRTFEI